MDANVRFTYASRFPLTEGAYVSSSSLPKPVARYVGRFETPITCQDGDEISHTFVRTDDGAKMEMWLRRKGEEPRLLGEAFEQTP